MHPALVYLTVRSIRNSIVVRLRRLRRPRYLLIALAGVLYFAAMIFNRRHVGAFTVPPAYDGMARAGTAVAIAATMSLTWLLPHNAALRFTVSIGTSPSA